jgi:hypothetical protein
MTPSLLLDRAAAIAVAAGVTASVLRFRTMLRTTANPGRRALWLMFVLFALGTAGSMAPVYTAVTHLAGFNLIWPLQHAVIMVSVFAAQVFFLYAVLDWHDPVHAARISTAVRRHTVILVAAVCVMTALFAVVPTAQDFVYGAGGLQIRAGAATAGPGVVASLAVTIYAVYIGVLNAGFVIICLRWAARTDRVWLRRGLRTIALGCAMTVGYTAHKLVYMYAWLAGWTPTYPEVIGVILLGLPSTVVVIIGATTPAWGPRIGATRLWWQRYRARRTLYPLWSALYQAVPQIALDPIPSAARDRRRIRDADWLLYRRVIEIWDARGQLRPYIDQAVRRRALRDGRAAGLSGDRLAAHVEAAGILSALSADRTVPPPPDQDAVAPLASGGNLATEVEWWTKVARAARRASKVSTSKVSTGKVAAGKVTAG